MRRKFPDNPILAVGGIVKKNNKILLVKRKNPPDKNLWSIPGGAVELGETLITAVKREIKEECGISVANGKIIALIDKIYFENDRVKYHYCITDFLFEEFSGSIRPKSDALEAKFFGKEEILRKEDVALSVKNLILKLLNKKRGFPLYLNFTEK